jgi:hypothetical protein
VATLEQRRIEACRLRPDRALGTFAEAETFLEERGLLTLTPSCSLPSLFGACHEEPHSPGKGGYGDYPKTRWWWGGALEASDAALATKLHRGKTLFLARRVVGLVDPLCRAEVARAAAGDHGTAVARAVAHLRAAGPSTSDDLKQELGLGAPEYQKVKRRLEMSGIAVSRHLEVAAANGGHRHVSELSLWDQVVAPANAPSDDALRALLVAAVDAAVVAPEKEARAWFTWKIAPALVDDAVECGELARVGGSLVTLKA